MNAVQVSLELSQRITAAVYPQGQNPDVSAIIRTLFGINLTPTQEKIVRVIAFGEHKRVCISCFTRFGKSRSAALGVSLYLLLNVNKRVVVVCPQESQTGILQAYISEAFVSCPLLASLLEVGEESVAERLRAETSKRRITLKNGCEVKTLSAHGDSNRVMGHGANLLLKDEVALINSEAEARIFRMLGDSAKDSAVVELSNPWNKSCSFYTHWRSGDYLTIHANWQTGIKEGRITREFVDEARRELEDTPLMFKILYESEFPDEAVDSLINFSLIEQAEQRKFVMDEASKYILSGDIADQGDDKTVLVYGAEYEDQYQVLEIQSFEKLESMAIAARIVAFSEKHRIDEIHIDSIGLGVGLLSRLKELFPKKRVIGCHFGERANDPQKYFNKKAQNYFRLRQLFVDGRITIPHHPLLKKDLLAMRWELTSDGKMRIVDPDRGSPDFADAMCFFVWHSPRGQYFVR